MKQQLNEVTQDRNAKATQLAPFLALANSRYENAPEDKRLELLIDRLEAATQTLLRVAEVPPKRKISPSAQKQILERLDYAKAMTVSITSPMAADGTADLAEQLRAIFEKAGFKTESAVGIFTKQPVGLIIEATPPLSPEIEDALLLVFKDLGEAPKFYRAAEGADPSRISIIVGSAPSVPNGAKN